MHLTDPDFICMRQFLAGWPIAHTWNFCLHFGRLLANFVKGWEYEWRMYCVMSNSWLTHYMRH